VKAERQLPALAVGPDEAAEMLSVSRDHLDRHIAHEAGLGAARSTQGRIGAGA
jgi:hypothetical protein